MTAVTAVAASLAVAACSSGVPAAPDRPTGLHYVTLEDWHIDRALHPTAKTGAVTMEGMPGAGASQREWSSVAVLGFSAIAAGVVVRNGGTLAEAFADPGGYVHIGSIAPNIAAKLVARPDLITLVGGNAVTFQVVGEEPDGTVEYLKTRSLAGEVPIPIDTAAKEFPGAIAVASP